ncbi:MAG: 3-phosphoglycerate dehydrogenase [Coxiella sp. (in: Bacteria)]|nr:MAG: 3-phosphoglycerate dehydrogenase [Coxiella sp. (in: g-proteobacteria)]
MFTIRTYNNIAQIGLDEFDATRFKVGADLDNPNAILLRSQSLHDIELPSSVELIVRAGAGTNNIPIEQMATRGIPVLNTPGANANAVKELVITGMLLACRNICHAWQYVTQLKKDDDVHKNVEKQKKQFAGFELPGKTLGIIGLGNIGVKVANAACALDMKVIGYDPAMTVQNAWELNANVAQAEQIDDVLAHADFISVHVPLIEQTKNLIDAAVIKKMKPGAIVLNFARNGIVDNQALLAGLQSKQIACYVCDFPEIELLDIPNIICLPHLGASTREAEENCAVMAARQVMQFLDSGQIKHSVNFPNVTLAKTHGHRLSVINANVPNMVAQISTVLSDAGLNIIDMINKSRNDTAYTLIDVDNTVTPSLLDAMRAIEGVIRVKSI